MSFTIQVSFIVPAFNEAALLGACLNSIDEAVAARCEQHISTETIVVDNNSTDATAAIAEAGGATVVFEAINQISRARNTGASVAAGDWLIFIDADSELNSELLGDVLTRIEAGGYIGFGSKVTMGDAPFWSRQLLRFWTWLSAKFDWAAGSFIVCEAAAFHELGGFSEKLFAAEEVEFSRRVKRLAKRRGSKFLVLTQNPLKTSNRKLHLYSGWEMFRQIARLVATPRKTLRDKGALDVWYGGRR